MCVCLQIRKDLANTHTKTKNIRLHTHTHKHRCTQIRAQFHLEAALADAAAAACNVRRLLAIGPWSVPVWSDGEVTAAFCARPASPALAVVVCAGGPGLLLLVAGRGCCVMGVLLLLAGEGRCVWGRVLCCC